MEMYTTLYSFMSRSLGLHGAEKEVFAVIYGFWKANCGPAVVKNKTILGITGLSPASIAASKLKLINKGLITVDEVRGKPSIYSVVLPEELSDLLNGPDNGPNPYNVQRHPKNVPQKEHNFFKNNNKKTKKYGNRSLDVGNRKEFEMPDKI